MTGSVSLVFSTDTTDLNVYLGRQNQQGRNPNEQMRIVARIMKHPDYNERTREKDIALVLLGAPVAFTDFISPVCLAANGSTFHNDTHSWTSGWGDNEQGGKGRVRVCLTIITSPREGFRQCLSVCLSCLSVCVQCVQHGFGLDSTFKAL